MTLGSGGAWRATEGEGQRVVDGEAHLQRERDACEIVRGRGRAMARARVKMVRHTSESATASHSLSRATRCGALPCSSPFRMRLTRFTPSLYAAPSAPPDSPSSANHPMSAREKLKRLSSPTPMTKSPWPRPGIRVRGEVGVGVRSGAGAGAGFGVRVSTSELDEESA